MTHAAGELGPFCAFGMLAGSCPPKKTAFNKELRGPRQVAGYMLCLDVVHPSRSNQATEERQPWDDIGSKKKTKNAAPPPGAARSSSKPAGNPAVTRQCCERAPV